ncbi:hypothetical protein SAMN05660772_01878 [Pasteurella testudinis DSM 23072]|uniref:Uncharacterized protein n=1 Tax=Pasteurella testudinis DSM 23072 TaxID=1122938 RepID=A0A1W1UKB4_9PAST|nr:hypothetical protein [Pasteurella testudinis]SMB81517.1 hypothetical protein SAMN05660772_01878 [Pasteurella testudinis DSM 23072]SUB51437.1 Uncharacterised protein [Pasteurella testudinis]
MTTINFEVTTRLIQKLRNATQKHAALKDTAKSVQKEQELKTRMAELADDNDETGSALVDTARELQALRNNRAKQSEKVEENNKLIGQLKFLLHEELAKIDVDERTATLEDVGL